MTTEMISLSEYRKNISNYTKRANAEKTCFIITSHGTPIGEYRPIEPKDIVIATRYSQQFIDKIATIDAEQTQSNVDELFSRLLK